MSFSAPELETEDDGLPMRSSGDWAYGKLHYVNEYIFRFIVSMQSKQWRAIHYIDLFSGPGKNRLENGKFIHGSPILALLQPRSFNRYFFADSNPQNIEVLKKRCASFGESISIDYYVGDANQVVDAICNYIQKVDKEYIPGAWRSLNLAFLDPEGLELHWETVEKLAQLRTDMIIYYPQMAITRNADNAPEAIDHYFGDTGWRQIYTQHKLGNLQFLHRSLLDYYKKKLENFGYVIKDPLDEPLFTNSKEAPLYRLLFVSKHQLGNAFWENVNRKLPNGQLKMF